MEPRIIVPRTASSDIGSRIDELELHCRAMTMPALHDAVDDIRRRAEASNLAALEAVARAFERSIARDRSATAFGLYFEQMRLAAACGAAAGPAGREAMLAAISVRLSG